jgi:hypothetical protein
MFNGPSAKTVLLFLSMTMGPFLLLAVAAILFLRPEPLKAEVFFGCYMAIGAPALLIGPEAIRIVEPLRLEFSYVNDRRRPAIVCMCSLRCS